MPLTYRGQAYNYTSATLLPVATTGVTRTLFYRGCAYQCACPALPPSRLLGSTGVYRTLFYRGVSYRCQLATMQLTQLPKAINWRFAGASEVSKQHVKPAH